MTEHRAHIELRLQQRCVAAHATSILSQRQYTPWVRNEKKGAHHAKDIIRQRQLHLKSEHTRRQRTSRATNSTTTTAPPSIVIINQRDNRRPPKPLVHVVDVGHLDEDDTPCTQKHRKSQIKTSPVERTANRRSSIMCASDERTRRRRAPLRSVRRWHWRRNISPSIP